MTGLASYTGRAGEPPTPAGTVVVDEHTATLAALHTVQALYHRERTGEGQRVETNLLNAAIDLQCNELTYAMTTGEDLDRGEKTHGHPYLYPPYGIYRTTDGHVAIGMAPLETIAETFDIQGLTDYDGQRELFENRDEIHDVIESHTETRSTDDVVDDLVTADVQASAIRYPTEVESNPQVQYNDMAIELERPDGGSFKTTGSPASMSAVEPSGTRSPPALGADTRDVLEELGYDDEEVDRLVVSGAVRVSESDGSTDE